MCEDKKKPAPLQRAKQDFLKAKEKLRTNISENDSTICEFISHIWERNVNVTSAEGRKFENHK
jgi:hypothetical protein